eukprot:scaffold31201_cov52-Attheya_sp.AAC.4
MLAYRGSVMVPRVVRHSVGQWTAASRALLSTKNSHATDTPKVDSFDKISFIGCGKMAEAMIAPLIATGFQSAKDIAIYDVSKNAMHRFKEQYEDIQLCESIPDCVDGADLIVAAIKPQNCCKVFQEIRRAAEMPNITLRSDDAILLSIIAGKPMQDFLDGTPITKMARSMPNTPAQIGKGMTVWTCTPNIELKERAQIKHVLSCMGKSIFVDDESFIDMSTSISGSGPAYIFMLMEAMIDAGVHMGFSRNTATTLVHQTILGSTLYAMETGLHPAILRNSVTSPAGTTASAMYELENGKFRTVIKDAIWACYRRSLEMGGQDSNVGPGRITYNQPPAPMTVHYQGAFPPGLNLNREDIIRSAIPAPSGEVTDEERNAVNEKKKED